MAFLKLYLIAFAVFFAVDLVWLGLVAKKFYRKHLGFLMRPKPDWLAALIFYLVFIAGIVFFAVLPCRDAACPGTAFLYGGLFGFVAYATYDLTNLATLKDWPLVVTVVDLIWGTVLCGLVAGLTTWIVLGLTSNSELKESA